MKNKPLRLLTLGAIATLALASCNKNNNTEGNVPENGFRAIIEQTGGNGSRTHINPDNWNDGTTAELRWTTDDLIKVANNGGATGCQTLTYQLTDGAGTTNGTFYTGEEHSTFFTPDYVAIYPTTNEAGVANTLDGTTATFNLPATQTYKASSFAEKSMPMVAYSTDQTLNFKNVLGGICFPIVCETPVQVTRIVLISNNADDVLWGTCTTTISTTGGDPTSVVANSDAAKNAISLDCSTNGGVNLGNTPTYFCIMVPEGKLASGFTVEAYNGTTCVYTVSTDTNPTITRSGISVVNTNLKVKLYGPYQVSDVLFVCFSPGNLQWSATNGGSTPTTHNVAGGGTAAGTWRFADHQWDYVGDDTYGTVCGVDGNSVTKCDNAQIGENYKGWIDLFGWGTSGYHDANDPYNTNYYPYSTSTSTVNTSYNYYGYGPSTNMTDPNLTGTSANYDWGVYNDIQVGNTTIPAGTYRTLTNAEWDYLFNTRPGATVNGNSRVRFTMGIINTDGTSVKGIILFPDGGVTIGSDAVTTWGPFNNSNLTENFDWELGTKCTTAQWAALEEKGCVFLPATGYRGGTSGTQIIDTSVDGGYWSSTWKSNGYTCYLDTNRVFPNPPHGGYSYAGSCVRLVRENMHL